MEVRPWGTFEVLCKNEKFVIKKLVVFPGKRTSLQYHNHREEYWIILDGSGRIVKGDEVLGVKKGDFVKIEKREKHRIENNGSNDLVILEVWVGDVLDENDIVRLEDDYGRA